MANPCTRVLIADDSATVRQFLQEMVDRDGQLTVVGLAADGLEAVAQTRSLMPDVVLMDIVMPVLDGYEATRRIMAECPVPIVITSSGLSEDRVQKTFLAIQAGAVAAVQKPAFSDLAQSDGRVRKLNRTLKLMSEVKIVTRHDLKQRQSEPGTPVPIPGQEPIELIAVGASTGGPKVLHTIFSGLPSDFPIPIAVVQHISVGFLAGMVDWLNSAAPLRVQIARAGVSPKAGGIYFAPDENHMGVTRDGLFYFSREPAENGIRPSVSHLFRSVARNLGSRAVGILLTGMGRDGAAELDSMRRAGALTLAQDEASSVVHGMPGEAIKMKAARHIMNPEEISSFLLRLAGIRARRPEM